MRLLNLEYHVNNLFLLLPCLLDLLIPCTECTCIFLISLGLDKARVHPVNTSRFLVCQDSICDISLWYSINQLLITNPIFQGKINPYNINLLTLCNAFVGLFFFMPAWRKGMYVRFSLFWDVTLRNNSEERRSYIQRGGSLKTRKIEVRSAVWLCLFMSLSFTLFLIFFVGFSL
jgi:hypothetical protein